MVNAKPYRVGIDEFHKYRVARSRYTATDYWLEPILKALS